MKSYPAPRSEIIPDDTLLEHYTGALGGQITSLSVFRLPEGELWLKNNNHAFDQLRHTSIAMFIERRLYEIREGSLGNGCSSEQHLLDLIRSENLTEDEFPQAFWKFYEEAIKIGIHASIRGYHASYFANGVQIIESLRSFLRMYWLNAEDFPLAMEVFAHYNGRMRAYRNETPSQLTNRPLSQDTQRMISAVLAWSKNIEK